MYIYIYVCVCVLYVCVCACVLFLYVNHGCTMDTTCGVYKICHLGMKMGYSHVAGGDVVRGSVGRGRLLKGLKGKINEPPNLLMLFLQVK